MDTQTQPPTAPPASHRLRLHRVTLRSAVYLITSVTNKRERHFDHPGAAGIVAQSMQHFHDRQYLHGFAWVVMPDHIHWLFQLRVGTLANIMRVMKTWTGGRVRKLLGLQGRRVWMPGYHDRRVRQDECLRKYIHYLVMNPVRWGLVAHPKDYSWLYAESEILDIAGAEPREFGHDQPK